MEEIIDAIVIYSIITLYAIMTSSPTFFQLFLSLYALLYYVAAKTIFKENVAARIFYLLPLLYFKPSLTFFAVLLASVVSCESLDRRWAETVVFGTLMYEILDIPLCTYLLPLFLLIFSVEYFRKKQRTKKSDTKIFIFAFLLYFIHFILSYYSENFYRSMWASSLLFGAIALDMLSSLLPQFSPIVFASRKSKTTESKEKDAL